MPLFMAAVGLVALVQLFVYLGQWLSKMQVARFLAEHGLVIEWVLYLAAGVAGGPRLAAGDRANATVFEAVDLAHGCSRQADQSSRA